MGIVPDDRLKKIEFYEAHLAPWGSNATAIGLTVAAVAALTAATEDARKAYDDHVAAQSAARAATQDFYDKVRLMHNAPGAGADMLRSIKNFALSSDDPKVYVLAQIPPPATPGSTPPPGTPFDFNVGLLQDGALELRWKCNNPSGTVGTIYEVRRALAGGAMQFVGASGVKSFIDNALPGGAATPVTYQITAVRSTARGNPAQFSVNFGGGAGGGAFTVSVQDASNATTRTSSENAASSTATPSTVNGRAVQKVLANANGSAAKRR